MTDLINTLDTPGEFDALARLRPDEPFFPLVGRDRLAPPLVYKWAADNRARAIAEKDHMTPDAFERELRKSSDAEAISWAMQEYKAGQIVKVVRDRPVTYSGHELPEDVKRRDVLQSARSRSATALNGAVAELVELVALLRSGDEAEQARADLYGLKVEEMMALSDDVKPPRVTEHPAPLLET